MYGKIFTVLLCILAFAFLADGQKPSSATTQTTWSRYQLINTRLGDNQNSSGELFVIDTARGRVWKYQREFETHLPGGRVEVVPESFVPVGMGRPVIATPGNGLKDSAEEDPIGH